MTQFDAKINKIFLQKKLVTRRLYFNFPDRERKGIVFHWHAVYLYVVFGYFLFILFFANAR